MNWQECWATGGLSHFVAFLCGGAMGLIFAPIAWAIYRASRELDRVVKQSQRHLREHQP